MNPFRAPAASVTCVALLGMLALPALAQEKFQLRFGHEGQTSKYLGQHVFDVGDVPGHQVRIYNVQRTYSAESRFDVQGVRVLSSTVAGYSDYTGGVGPIWGYEVWKLADGGQVTLQYTGSTFSEPTATGSRTGAATSVSRVVGGTGRYAKLRGMLHAVSTFDTDPKTGYSQLEARGEFWFEQ